MFEPTYTQFLLQQDKQIHESFVCEITYNNYNMSEINLFFHSFYLFRDSSFSYLNIPFNG